MNLHAFAQTANVADRILGTYLSAKKDAKIEIYKKGSKYFGKTVWNARAAKDIKNPDKSLRNRDIIGADFLTNFSFEDGEYVDGKVYDPRNGKSYDCKMTLSGNKLKIRGFIGIPTFGKTETFTKVE
jgi:uncharacterized protein (DUF2147 family)